jgi:hypothetical protein
MEKTGKILENRAGQAEFAPNYRSPVSDLRREFPARANREFIRGEQGIVFAEQGSEQRLQRIYSEAEARQTSGGPQLGVTFVGIGLCCV